MTRIEAQNTFNTIENLLLSLVKSQQEPTTQQSISMALQASYIIRGVVDAILETRDNSREIEKINPFGPDYQQKVGK